MSSNREIEVKFRVENVRELSADLKKSGFRLKTRKIHEFNALYDLAGFRLRKRGELLRLRKYGSTWTITFKSKGKSGRHKIRTELETEVANGPQMEAVLRALGFRPSFRYEKFRAEWTDGEGQVVIDETPIGTFGEIEGKSRWIDSTAKALEVSSNDYITQSYAELFLDWKKRSNSPARNMTFKEVKR